MTIEEAIGAIVKKEGINILRSPDRIQSMLMDYAGNDEKGVTLFCWACQRGLLCYAQKFISQKKETNIKDIALEAKRMLQNDAFMAEEYAIYSVNMLLNGLGIALEINSDSNEKENDERFIRDLQLAQERNVNALLSLGKRYLYGIGVKKSWVVAEYYYRRAQEFGDNNQKKEAVNRLNEIYNNIINANFFYGEKI